MDAGCPCRRRDVIGLPIDLLVSNVIRVASHAVRLERTDQIHGICVAAVDRDGSNGLGKPQSLSDIIHTLDARCTSQIAEYAANTPTGPAP